jgi:hypothetical protein
VDIGFLVDTYKNGALLQILGVDPADTSPANPPDDSPVHVASQQS